MKKYILIVFSFICILFILTIVVYRHKTDSNITKQDDLILTAKTYNKNINTQGLNEFIQWQYHANPSIKETKRLVKKYKSQLWNISFEYKKQIGISLFTAINSNYINNWASPETIADFLNFWIKEEYKYNKNGYYSESPIFYSLIADIQIKNNNAIQGLIVEKNSFEGTIKNKYLHNSEEQFVKWLNSIKPIQKNDNNYTQEYYSLLESLALSQRDYNSAINSNIKLCSFFDIALPYKMGPMTYKLEPVSNIAKYSYIMNKVSQKARNIIVDYYNLYAKHKGALKDLSKSIRGKCIIDVVKKYDLLNGKPKDGYYYPVNDMKIKVESD